MSDTILYDYWRSTASYRVRIALNLANIKYQSTSIDLLQGEHLTDAHLEKHPQGLVPVLDIDGKRFTQSLAIIDYLNSTHDLRLLPADPALRATVRALSYTIAMDVHPVCNLSVVGYATNGLEPARTEWMQHFISKGLGAFEQQLKTFESSKFCVGNNISMADLCLIPQLYNANRWGVDYSDHTRIKGVAEHCATLEAFEMATPENVRRA
ncbi:MAG: maleylacetoacetate isomerase [Granulosicoccus sp.]